MPDHVGYIERDGLKRPYIYEWTNQYERNYYEIDAECGVGYFIQRTTKDVHVAVPKYPYDGDVFSIIDTTKEVDLATATGEIYLDNVYPTHVDGASILYNSKHYVQNQKIKLDYLQTYQQFFIYIKSINTWVGSYINVDATLNEVVIPQTYGIIYYGECTSRGNLAEKTVSTDPSFVLGIGANVRVVFMEANTADAFSLNVNETRDVPVKLTRTDGDLCPPGLWKAGQAVDLVFDGRQWLVVHILGQGGGSAGGGSTGGGTTIVNSGLTEQEVNDLIRVYLVSNGITGVSNEQIRSYIVAYLEENGAQAGISASECQEIIRQYLESHNIQGSVDENQVNQLIAKYIRDHNIGSGGGGSSGGGSYTPVSDLFYGSCSTSASSSQKSVSVSSDTDATFYLVSGVSVRIKFSEGQNASSATLNVNSTGVKDIYTTNSTSASQGAWVAGEVVDFVYDGSKWLMVKGHDKAYTDNAIQTAINSLDFTDQITYAANNAVNTALETSVNSIIDSKTAQTIQAINAQVDAKIEALTTSVEKSLSDFDTEIDGTLAALRTEMNGVKTSLQSDISKALTDLQAEIQAAKQSIADGIDEQISTAFDSAIDSKIQANFETIVADMINASKTQLEQQITAATTDLTNMVTSANESLTNRITNSSNELNERITNLANDLEHNLTTEISSLRSEINNIIATAFSSTIDEKIDAAFSATIDAKIRAAFTDAEGTLNAAIAGYNQTINQRMTEIQTDLNVRLETIETTVTEALTTFENNINTIINETFNNAIDTKIDAAFQTRLEQMINAQFSAVIANQVDAAIEDLKTLLKADIKKANDDLMEIINNFTATIDARIETIYGNKIQGDLNTLKTQLQNEIQTKVNQLDASIDGKINTKFDSTIDTLMENKFSAMIDTKIEQNFNSTIDARMNAAKQEIYDGLNARIDARIRIAIDGEITTLINTKLEEYVAPAIGATY